MSENCLKGRCGACDTTFAIAALPMDLSQMAKVTKNISCPKCGSTEIYLDASEAAPDIPLEPSDGQHG